MQTRIILATHLPAVSLVSQRKKKKGQVKCCVVCVPTNLLAKINVSVSYNVLITNTFVCLFLSLCVTFLGDKFRLLSHKATGFNTELHSSGCQELF